MDQLTLPVTLTGQVTRFAGKGRSFGYPTANIAAATTLPDGVYFGLANLASYTQQPTMIFIGTPTTVGDRGRRVEAHLFDVDDVDYYGQDLLLHVIKYRRPSQTFGTIEELLRAMAADETAARQWFKAHGHL